MNLCCPGCGLRGPLECFSADKDARHFGALMGRVPPPLAEGLLRYLGLFAPAKHATTFAKARRLLEELVPMIEAGRIRRARREWPVSIAQWDEGLRHMAERRAQLTLPLKSHGYLLEVLAGAVDRLEAKAEAQGIQQIGRGERAAVAAEMAPLAAAGPAAALMAAAAAHQELKRVLATNQRLGITASQDVLRKHLAGLGHGAAAIDHALKQLEQQTT